jgi:hypothetical protein
LSGILFLNLKHINGIYIGAAEYGRTIRLTGHAASVSKNVNIGEGDMAGHGAQLAPFGIKIISIAYFVTAMTSYRTFSVNQCDLDFGTV